MKKHFLILLGIFIFMIIPNNAYAISKPTHICNPSAHMGGQTGPTCDNNPVGTNFFGSIPVWTSPVSEYSYAGSTDVLPTYVAYYWNNANFCTNEAMTIDGYLMGDTNFIEQLSLSLVMDVTFNNQTTRFPCAITPVSGGSSQQFSCSATNGGGSVNLTFIFDGYPINYGTSLGILQNTSVTCNPTNASVINNAIQNTQNIINNQNSNTQTLMSGLSSLSGNITNVIIDQQTNTQYLLNQGAQTIQAVNSVDNTMNNDTIDSNYQNSTLDGLNSQMASNNVISDLLLLPVTLYQKILNTLGSNSCSSFNLGSLYGTNLILPCIQVQNYVGSALWTTIDLIFSGMFILVIRKKFVDIFNNMTNLKDRGNEIE